MLLSAIKSTLFTSVLTCVIAPKNSVFSKLRKGIGNISKYKAFINQFFCDANPLLECQKILKTRGTLGDTYKKCKDLIKIIPPRSKKRKRP